MNTLWFCREENDQEQFFWPRPSYTLKTDRKTPKYTLKRRWCKWVEINKISPTHHRKSIDAIDRLFNLTIQSGYPIWWLNRGVQRLCKGRQGWENWNQILEILGCLWHSNDKIAYIFMWSLKNQITIKKIWVTHRMVFTI